MFEKKRVVIMGAAGRDFHNFNVCFREDRNLQVVAFTAFQIPNIAGRVYPPELAGEFYSDGIPIHEEEELAELLQTQDIDEVIFSYSDISHNDVMHRASLVTACGADFRLIAAQSTQLRSSKPVISVGAIRTGCGKSQTSRLITGLLHEKGRSVVVVRHPMPYGDLKAQRCQRFATLSDLDKYGCTIEEREEYEGHIRLGHVVYAGVDYGEILRSAEREAEIILWDGGNNDTPFYVSDLHIVLVDPLRPGHEALYHPGEANLRLADIIVVPKIGSATFEQIEQVKNNIASLNPEARLIEADSEVSSESEEMISGKRVLVIEDGPTLTHGEMSYGAGWVAARKFGASEIVDPRPYAVGSIKEVFVEYPHIGELLPAMGYDDRQVAELKETIDAVPCDLALVGTPFDLGRLIDSKKPLLRVSYEVDQSGSDALEEVLDEFLDSLNC
jgi:predicted GTPase